MRLLKVSLTLLVVFTLATAAFTQTATSSLRGTVTDPQGGVIPGATVKLNSPSTGYSRTITTNDSGEYQFLQVKPGTYDVTASAKDMGTSTQKAVQLLISQPSTLDFKMKPSATTVVEVVGTAPPVNTTDATIGNAFNTQQILALPFEGRNAVEILSLQPGVAYTGPKTDPTFDSRSGAVNGARQDQTNITLDGVDNNDQNNGLAFIGALRTTLDSTQEFRVTTSNSNSDAGRSSGAQVTLLTKSGTNAIHGSLYEYNRSSIGEANDWFNKHVELQSGLANRPPKLVRNTFGGSIGGPIVKDRMFYFFNYEGRRKAEDVQVTRTVPSANLRNGMISYTCADDPTCPASGIETLTQAQFASMDPNCTTSCPWGGGVDPNILPVLQSYPMPNTNSALGADGLNYQGFTFFGANPERLNTWIGKVDLNVSQDGNHRIFVRANLQDDTLADPPQLPGQAANFTTRDNSKGIAIGYTAILSNSLINNLRYGYIRQGTRKAGISDQHHVTLRGLDNPQGFTRSLFVDVPVNNITDDITWTKGKHNVQFGGNLRVIGNDRQSSLASFFSASTNPSWLDFAAIAGPLGSPLGSLDPQNFSLPAVDESFGNSYDYPAGVLAGVIAQVDSLYNQNKTGAVVPEGSLINRNFKSHEAELYLQDAWRIKPNLTITAGLRYTLLQPPYERNGEQAAPTISVEDWFRSRGQAMQAGQTFNDKIQFDISGQANGKKPYWQWDYNDLAPRVAFAYSPGIWKKIFGGEGKTSIRGGWGIYYDHFGEGIVNSFDREGSFGLTTETLNPPGGQDVDCAPRFTSITTIPDTPGCGGSSLISPPPGKFPVTPPRGFDNGSFAIYWGLDDKIKTPYSHGIDFSIERELPGGFVLETAYVGRLGRQLLQQVDLAMPLDIVDPSSKMDYYGAATQLAIAAENNVDINSLPKIPYFENLFPAATGAGAPSLAIGFAGTCAPGAYPGSPTATQAMYDLYSCFLHNETTALEIADLGCIPACATLPGAPAGGLPFQFFNDQFSSLYAWRSGGTSSYHAAQLMLRHRMSHGFQFDFNYTLSKSIDEGSDAERIDFFSAALTTQDPIINSWNQRLNRSVSTFDTRHQINTNYVVELPFGRSRHFASGSGKVVDAFIGGWNLSGLLRWTSGFPFSVFNGQNWATNWELGGFAFSNGQHLSAGQFIDADGDPNIFKNGTDAINGFRFAHPGEVGQRNSLRGPGYFGMDMGLNKNWKFAESKQVQFSWSVYNVLNSVRFDALSAQPSLDSSGNFGKYNTLLTEKRRMEFGLRFEF